MIEPNPATIMDTLDRQDRFNTRLIAILREFGAGMDEIADTMAALLTRLEAVEGSL